MKPTSDTIASLPCKVQLPDTWAEGADKVAPSVTVYEELRRFCRWEFCSVAALEYHPSFPFLRSPSTWHRVYTINLARGGLSFLHSEPLFPRERAGIVLLDGSDHEIEIVRCRRIQDCCFEIGSRFVEISDTAKAPVGTTGQPR
jgi:hypothetical protein